MNQIFKAQEFKAQVFRAQVFKAQVFRAEWCKLRRPTLFFGTMLASAGLTGLVTSLLFLLIDSPQGNSDRGNMISRDILQLPSGLTIGFSNAAGLLGIVALCVFAAQTAQEYTYGTLRNLLVRQPRRLQLLLGKYVSMASFAVVMVILAAVSSMSLAFGLSGKAKVSTDAWVTSDALHEMAKTFGNVLLSVIAFGTVGMILGLLLRSPISAISLGVIWLLIVENILIAVKSSLGNWMPGSLMSTIAVGGTADISYIHSITMVAIYLVSSTAIVITLFKRRDVSN
jgi:ABC-type transport system involved in multi-copper enzyme maturation permease subunit